MMSTFAVGFASGEIPRIPLNLILLKGVVVKGFEIRTFAEHAPELAARDTEELHRLFAQGRLTPHISARYSLDDTGLALRSAWDVSGPCAPPASPLPWSTSPDTCSAP